MVVERWVGCGALLEFLFGGALLEVWFWKWKWKWWCLSGRVACLDVRVCSFRLDFRCADQRALNNSSFRSVISICLVSCMFYYSNVLFSFRVWSLVLDVCW